MNQPVDVAPLVRPMLGPATTTLARAFEDDPMFEWVFPDPETRLRRLRRLRRLNRVPLGYATRYGLVTTQTDGGRCVAIWVPPGKSMKPVRMVRSGILAVGWRLCVPTRA